MDICGSSPITCTISEIFIDHAKLWYNANAVKVEPSELVKFIRM